MKLIYVPTGFRTGTLRERLALLVGAGFGSGFSKLAPGTAGTVAAALMVIGLAQTELHAGATLLVLAVLSAVACLPLGPEVERICGKEDPGFFVLDEFAGFFVALSRLGGEWPDLRELGVAFVLFRLFDIVKPQPCRRLQDLKGGRGIVLDDVAAGLYALLGVVVFRDVMSNPPW